MKTWTLQAKIGADGILHIEVPSGFPPGPVEVVVVIQPLPELDGASHSEEVHTGSGQGGPESLNGRGKVSPQQNGAQVEPRLSERERLVRIAELLDAALVGVEWSEIEEGRQDRDFGN